MHLRPLGHLSGPTTLDLSASERRGLAERVGVEPTVPLRIHLISNQAPSATRSSLRRGLWQRRSSLSTPSCGDFPTVSRSRNQGGGLGYGGEGIRSRAEAGSGG